MSEVLADGDSSAARDDEEQPEGLLGDSEPVSWNLHSFPWKSPAARIYGITKNLVDDFVPDEGIRVKVVLFRLREMVVAHTPSLLLLEGYAINWLFHHGVLRPVDARVPQEHTGPWVYLGGVRPKSYQPPVWRDVLLAQLSEAIPPKFHPMLLQHLLEQSQGDVR